VNKEHKIRMISFDFDSIIITSLTPHGRDGCRCSYFILPAIRLTGKNHVTLLILYYIIILLSNSFSFQNLPLREHSRGIDYPFLLFFSLPRRYTNNIYHFIIICFWTWSRPAWTGYGYDRGTRVKVILFPSILAPPRVCE